MTRYAIRLLLFLAPFIAISALELFVWPVNRFTFRFYESLNVYSMQSFLPGPYYPNRDATMSEEGDLGYYTDFAEPRVARWVVDARGYRFDPQLFDSKKSSVMLLGDSMVVGTGMTQSDTLSEQLWKNAGIAAYPYAPSTLWQFLLDPEVIKHPPKVVVLIMVERLLKDLYGPTVDRPSVRGRWYRPLWLAPVVLYDRFSRATLLHFVRAEMRRAMKRLTGGSSGLHPGVAMSADHSMLFLTGEYVDHPKEQAQFTANVLADYEKRFAARGIRFIVMPVPNKSTVYYAQAGLAERPIFLQELITAARARGLEMIDCATPLENAAAQGTLVFQRDDSHWNREGVLIAERAMQNKLAAETIR